jgi:Domain of unknown function (DUF4383)
MRDRLLAPPAALQGQILLGYCRFISGGLLVLGILGFFRTGLDDFTNVTGHSLLMFTVNPHTNLIHVITGLVGMTMVAGGALWARRYALLVGGLGVPWAIAGFILDGSLSDFFARNQELNILHLCVSVVALVLAVWPRWPQPSPAETSPA